MTKSSEQRVKTFVDWFIRSEHTQTLESERDCDFYNYADRAARCAVAAEFGCDGKTHAEVIQDWRDAFDIYLRDRSRRKFKTVCGEYPERFMSAVSAHFDAVELWHENNGSLNQQIG